MAPTTATLAPPTDVLTDEDFQLDMRIVETTTTLVRGQCNTDDGCGDTCNTSACNTSSYDPA
ncbi:FxLD family lanthipeptide [Actinoplanes regularis]|uniref:FxLD family lantipeptide n=1 Tax=Actinoplanes regularis TaxID=52697 RepID=A0A239IVX4_9ACTN|nr:FxLD family lanthipeptide [Actinoplanes regularis]GIE91594.1 hypothetical protein Are01nite_80740 [Actinoplanes regularis]SNS97685.1 FxLD family lantipeptide [Actinoplanes regularis]